MFLHPNRQSGQAVTEYIVMLFLAVTIFVAIQAGFNRLRTRLWMQMSCDIIAACPGCPTPTRIRIIANKAASGACPR